VEWRHGGENSLCRACSVDRWIAPPHARALTELANTTRRPICMARKKTISFDILERWLE
jgi:hypothetical protein